MLDAQPDKYASIADLYDSVTLYRDRPDVAFYVDEARAAGGRAVHSVLSPGCRLHSHSLISDSILFPDVDVGRGARVHRAIVEKGVRIPAGFEVGLDADKDRESFHVTETGIVVIAKDTKIEA
jgi:ADP-glucose pyrophosphorylase